MSVEERPVRVGLTVGGFVLGEVAVHRLAGEPEFVVVLATLLADENGTRSGGSKLKIGGTAEAVCHWVSSP